MTSTSAKIRLILIGIAGYLVLLLPLSFNGSPIYWPDSIAYLQGGSTALAVATGFETKYSGIEKGRPENTQGTSTEAERATTDVSTQAGPQVLNTPSAAQPDYRISTARSPYYAVFLAWTSSVAGVQGPVYVQALLVLLALGLLIKEVFPEKQEQPALLLLFMVTLTSAGIFAAIMLPDVLTPLGLLSVAVLFAFWNSLGQVDKVIWYGLLLASVLSHTTHLAMILFLMPFAMLVSRVCTNQSVMKPAALVISGLVLGILSNIVFVQLVERHYGYKPQSFPMIAASIIVDGPGRAYLEATCPENGYVYCDYLDTKAIEVDQYLWSHDPDFGVYSMVDRQTKDRMSSEQWRFLIDTLHNDFIGQCKASLKRMFRQVTDNSLEQFAYHAGMKNQLLNQLPATDRDIIEQSALFNNRFPLTTVSRLSQWVGWGAVAALLVTLWRTIPYGTRNSKYPQDTTRAALTVLTILILIGFFINAGLTGAASQPQGRYSARVFLLFPVLLSVWMSFLLRTSSQIPLINDRR